MMSQTMTSPWQSGSEPPVPRRPPQPPSGNVLPPQVSVCAWPELRLAVAPDYMPALPQSSTWCTCLSTWAAVVLVQRSLAWRRDPADADSVGGGGGGTRPAHMGLAG